MNAKIQDGKLICGNCGKQHLIPLHAEGCCTSLDIFTSAIPATEQHAAAQNAMNQQQDEIKLCLKYAHEKNESAAHDYDLNDALRAQAAIIQALAKMNGVEDALK